jgi:hypothetical protein
VSSGTISRLLAGTPANAFMWAGFLTAWQPQNIWIAYIVSQGSES